MKRFFHSELDHFRTNIVLMGEKAIEITRLAMRCVNEQDPQLVKDVLTRDDAIDELEVEIDNEAVRYISLRSPVAGELRLLMVGTRVAYDLERVGDESTSIAKRVRRLMELMPVKDFAQIPEMGELVVEMLRDAVNCFVQQDVDKALSICARDEKIDQINKENFRHFTSAVSGTSPQVERNLELMFISKSLERIGDHATNIAEEVVYLNQGRDIRHSSVLRDLKKKERDLLDTE